MKIGISNYGSGFTNDWIAYCKSHNIDYKLVNPYESDIIEQLSDCDAFMWHHIHYDYRDLIFAKQLLTAIEASGKTVFPDYKTGWFFDDKVGEKYLFESLNIPNVPSYVFYNKEKALEWARVATYPKVFKLRGGAGSMNVMLVRNYYQAKRLINKAFGKGYKAFRAKDNFKERYKKWKDGKDTLTGVIKAVGRFFIIPKQMRLIAPQKGYAYFQEFMPNNGYDTRVAVIGGSIAYAFRRGVRKDDFRASGSGNIMYDNIDLEMIKIAFEAAEKLKSQSLALDFIYDKCHRPLVVEASYGFVQSIPNESGGYWTKDLKWHATDNCDICGKMIEMVVGSSFKPKK